MKRKKRLILTLLLLVVMTFVSCVGVGPSEKPPKDSGSKKETQSDVELKPGQKKLVSKHGTFIFNEEGYPITDNPSTFTILAATKLLSFDDSEVMNNIAKETNIYPEWICIPTSAAVERTSLMFASGDYPDVLGPNTVSKSATIEYGPKGVLLNVKDLLRKYATNFNDLLTPDLWAQMECYDGNIYFIPTIYANRGGTANGTQDNYFVMPQAWMDKLGLEVATNIDELYNNLVAIRDGDPNGNGIKDEIPLAIHALSGNSLDALPSYFAWFGRIGGYYVDDDGTVIDGRLYDEHREGIKFLRKCYKEGLLDKEIFSLDRDAFRTKGAADPAVYGYIFGYTATYYTSREKAEELYEPMPLLKDQNGNIQYLFKNRSSSGISYQAAITSACENPELVIRWANYLHTPEITLQTNDGPFGVRYGYDENGNLYRYNDLENPDKIPEGYDSFAAYCDANREQQVPRFYGPLVDDYLKEKFGFVNELSIVQIQNYKAEEMWEPYAVQEFPIVTASKEENEEESLYSVDISKLYNETVTAWIIGEGDVDAEWDNFVKQMNDFGAQEILKVKQAQSDRYFEALGQ